MSRYDLVIDGKPFEVEILELHVTHAKVEVNGVGYDVEIAGSPSASVAVTASATAPAPRAKPAAASATSGTGGGTIVAPMPGSIWSIPVAVGDKVAAGATVIVVEAMKMENEIKTSKAGTVKQILVQKSQEVAVGAPLVIVE